MACSVATVVAQEQSAADDRKPAGVYDNLKSGRLGRSGKRRGAVTDMETQPVFYMELTDMHLEDDGWRRELGASS